MYTRVYIIIVRVAAREWKKNYTLLYYTHNNRLPKHTPSRVASAAPACLILLSG